jgi:putative ATP-dependent endonuclease of OLD family
MIRERAQGWSADPDAVDEAQLLKDIEVIGKGRFAQRVSSTVAEATCPTYIREAIEYVVERC